MKLFPMILLILLLVAEDSFQALRDNWEYSNRRSNYYGDPWRRYTTPSTTRPTTTRLTTTRPTTRPKYTWLPVTRVMTTTRRTVPTRPTTTNPVTTTTPPTYLQPIVGVEHRVKHRVEHRRASGDSRIIFPSSNHNVRSVGNKTVPAVPSRNAAIKEIPLSLFKKLSSLKNASQFVDEFVMKPPQTELLLERPGGLLSLERPTTISSRQAGASLAPLAVCSPQPTTVNVDLDNDVQDSNVIFYPSCVRLDRCSGCCSHELLTCSPTKTESVSYQIMKARYVHETSAFELDESVTKSFERHLSCDCVCRIKETDCNLSQVYRPNECRCECRNQEESQNCSGVKFWDPTHCTCRCRETAKECSSGLMFNNDTCTCEADRSSHDVSRPNFRGF